MDISDIGRRVRYIRMESKISLDKLSEASGVSRRMISSFEGGSNISLEKLDKILKGLGYAIYIKKIK